MYAVRSTGVFCRPSCPSRRPHRTNVVFFATAGDARAAGYRPCKRCHPESPALDPWIEKVARACDSLASGRHDSVARRAGGACRGSPYHFQRNFKRIVGVTPREYAEAYRLPRVKHGLRRAATVTDAMLDSGYESSSRFYGGAAQRLGMPAASYQRGGSGATIGYSITPSTSATSSWPRRRAASARWRWVTRRRRSRHGLRREYPAAAFVEAGERLRHSVRRILDDLSGKRPALDLPLDVQATAFQWQVWKALRAIPRGETRTYAEVAEAIGQPGGAGRGARLRHQPRRADGAVSSRRAGVRRRGRLSLGRGAQAGAARSRRYNARP